MSILIAKEARAEAERNRHILEKEGTKAIIANLEEEIARAVRHGRTAITITLSEVNSYIQDAKIQSELKVGALMEAEHYDMNAIVVHFLDLGYAIVYNSLLETFKISW